MQNGNHILDEPEDEYFDSYDAYGVPSGGSADYYQDTTYNDQYNDAIGACMRLYARGSNVQRQKKNTTRLPRWGKPLTMLRTTTTCFLTMTLRSRTPRRCQHQRRH